MIYTVTLNPSVDRQLTVPSLSYDTVLRASSWRIDPGGKGFNVSRMLMALGTQSTALGFAAGKSGEWLRDRLEAAGIATDFVWVEGETRTNISIINESNSRYIKVNEPGPEISAESQTRLAEQVSQLAQPGDWWVLAGSLPPGVPATIYADLIERVRAAGAHAVLDTSGPALQAGCEAGPHLVKPNDVEAAALTGLPVTNHAERIAAAARIHAMGVDHVVISLGKEGALLANSADSLLASSPRITERNPIGAGDSMVGGLVWSLAREQPLSEALRWGIACGAASAAQDGTAVGTWEQVQSLAEQVVVRPLK